MSLFRRKPRGEKPKPLRRGLYSVAFTGSGLLNKGVEIVPVVEVSEWERVGAVSRVTIDRISGAGGYEEQVRGLLPDWLPTASIQWRA